MAKKFYAVKKGKKKGIFTTWEECQASVNGVSSAEFKGFKTLEEAEKYLGKQKTQKSKKKSCRAFVDGSYNSKTCVYGYGGYVINGNKKHIVIGSGTDKEMALMHNVAGEIMGSMAVIEKAIELNFDEITIYYDYEGIEKWATGKWKRNKKGTKGYYEFIQAHNNKIKIQFVKVKAHSGVEGNEIADKLAKRAVGLLGDNDVAFLEDENFITEDFDFSNEIDDNVEDIEEVEESMLEPISSNDNKFYFTTLPIVYEKALKKAQNNGESISDVITNFLIEYISG